MDMNSVNFLVGALFSTLLIAVGQRPPYSAPIVGSPIGPVGLVPAPSEQRCALNMDTLRQQTGEAATYFLSEEAAMSQPAPNTFNVVQTSESESVPDYCEKTCQWQVLNFALLGEDGILYTPATGQGEGQTLLYQSIYSCKCRSPGNTCGGECRSSPAKSPGAWDVCVYLQYNYLPAVCKCPERTCQHSYSWHLTLVLPNYQQSYSCTRPVWKRVRIPTGCCCKVTRYNQPRGYGK